MAENVDLTGTVAPPTDYAAKDDKGALSESAARQQVRVIWGFFFVFFFCKINIVRHGIMCFDRVTDILITCTR